MVNKERIANVGKVKDVIGEIESNARAGIDVSGQLATLRKIQECLEHAIKKVRNIVIFGKGG